MTTATIRRVQATVTLKAEEEDGWHLGLTAPDLGAKQYPIHVYRVPAEDAAKTVKGQAYLVALERGPLQKPDKDPSRDTNYRWYWRGFSSAADTDPAPAPAQPTPQRHGGGMDEETTRRITFLSSLNAAAHWAQGHPNYADDPDKVLTLAHLWADAAFTYGRYGDAQDAPSEPTPKPPLVRAAEALGAEPVAEEPPASTEELERRLFGDEEAAPKSRDALAAYVKRRIEAKEWTAPKIKEALGGRYPKDAIDGVLLGVGGSEEAAVESVYKTLRETLDGVTL